MLKYSPIHVRSSHHKVTQDHHCSHQPSGIPVPLAARIGSRHLEMPADDMRSPQWAPH